MANATTLDHVENLDELLSAVLRDGGAGGSTDEAILVDVSPDGEARARRLRRVDRLPAPEASEWYANADAPSKRASWIKKRIQDSVAEGFQQIVCTFPDQRTASCDYYTTKRVSEELISEINAGEGAVASDENTSSTFTAFVSDSAKLKQALKAVVERNTAKRHLLRIVDGREAMVKPNGEFVKFIGTDANQ